MLPVVSSCCVLLFSLGLDQAYIREYHETKQKPGLLKIAILPGLSLLVLALSFSLLIPGAVSKMLFATDSTIISIIVTLYILSDFISRFLSLILRMQERGLAYSMSQILPKLLFLIVISSYIVFSLGFDFYNLVLAHTASVFMVTLVYVWNTRREWVKAISERIDRQKLKTMLMFGLPLIIGGLASWGLMTMDRIFLRSLSTFQELGIFSVSASISAFAMIFQSVFSTIWAPIVYKWSAKGLDTDKIDKITEYVLAIVVFVFILAGLFSWVITFLLPDAYNRVQYIIVACMGYPLFYTLSETTVVGLGITRKSMYAMNASIIAMLVSIALNFFLVPSYGASGAAASTATAFWFFLLCRTEFSSHVWRPLPRKKLYITTLACLIMAITFSLFGEHYHRVLMGLWLIMLFTSTIIFKKSLKTGFQYFSYILHNSSH